MTDRLPPALQKLFLPNPPLLYAEPADHEPQIRRTAIPSAITEFLDELRTEDDGYVATNSKLLQAQIRKEEKVRLHKEDYERQLQSYDPKKDDKAQSDPYKTLFVGRLAYDTTDEDLIKAFGKFGEIKTVRIVRNADGTTPKKINRGYAFVEFDREKDFKDAYKHGDALVIKGRRVLIDCERGRTVSGWKPRRLGGGLGGRHYTKQHVRSGMSSGGFGAPAGPRGGFRGGFSNRGGGGFGGGRGGGRPMGNGGSYGGGRFAPDGAPAGPRGPRPGGYGGSNGYSGGGGGGGRFDDRGVTGSNMEPVRPRERNNYRDRDREGGYDRDYSSSRKRDYDGGDYDSSRKRRY